jgi:hypothetical protein
VSVFLSDFLYLCIFFYFCVVAGGIYEGLVVVVAAVAIVAVDNNEVGELCRGLLFSC